MTDQKHATPLLDELEKGPWPSFVKEIKKSAKSPMVFTMPAGPFDAPAIAVCGRG